MLLVFSLRLHNVMEINYSSFWCVIFIPRITYFILILIRIVVNVHNIFEIILGLILTLITLFVEKVNG